LFRIFGIVSLQGGVHMNPKKWFNIFYKLGSHGI
jgi:hypothetical protein